MRSVYFLLGCQLLEPALALYKSPLGSHYKDQALSASAPVGCPATVMASVPLPSPLPTALEEALHALPAMLRETVETQFPAQELPSAAMLRVAYQGEVLLSAAAGDRDPRVKAGAPDGATIFRIGSVTKLFPVLMLYQLLDRGIVKSLDDPLSLYAEGFRPRNVHSRSRRAFTLRQLASQLSGLPRESPCPSVLQCNVSTSEIIERLNEGPGAISSEYARASYSNFAYALLGNVLAEHVGTTFHAYVQENILDPLGMHDTGYVINAAVEARMAKSYGPDGTEVPNFDIGWNGPAGQMYSTLDDLMKLGSFYLGLRGELFDDGLRKELLMPEYLFAGGSFLIGAPWEMQVVDAGRWTVLAKGGNIPGFSALLAVVPQLNLSISAVWSGQFDETGFIRNVSEALLPPLAEALVAERPAPTSPSDPTAYVGVYNATGPDASAVASMGLTSLEIAHSKLPNGDRALELVGQGWLDFQDDKLAVLTSAGTDNPLGCFFEMAGGSEGQWVTFQEVPGLGLSLMVPGLFYVPFALTKPSMEVVV